MDSLAFILENPAVLHPMAVHLPIAYLVTALFIEILGSVSKREHLKVFTEWMVYLGAVTAVVAAGAGWIASESLGHDSPGHDLVHLHRDFMVSMTVGLVLTALSLFFFKVFRNGSMRKGLLPILVFLTGIMFIGADKGGQLVYKHGTGVNPAIIKTPDNGASAGHHHDGEETVDHHAEKIVDHHADKTTIDYQHYGAQNRMMPTSNEPLLHQETLG
ncbi:MAG: DUF2231 domain-containing protein, partial [Magnetococcales bacterium]|nr:DUF2231 domain-containing protein [Magnetococcales bacterium]